MHTVGPVIIESWADHPKYASLDLVVEYLH